jgi:hypothetical protein
MNQVAHMPPRSELLMLSPEVKTELQEIERSLSFPSRLDDYTELLPVGRCQGYLEMTAHRERACTPDIAANAVKNIAGVYPRSSIGDPDRWAGAVVAILAEFPEAVVHRCWHPLTGIMRTSKFLPVPAEIVAWCDAERQRQRMLRYRAKWMIDERERRIQVREEEERREEERRTFLAIHPEGPQSLLRRRAAEEEPAVAKAA